MNQPLIRVLLVEDDDSFRLSAEHLLLTTPGFDVTACSSGESAIEVLASQTVDVMVLDHQMPGMTGLNVLQWLHERKQFVPTLMLTGAGSEHIAVEALKMGAFDYIRKDHLELKRLPIVINGLHERKLFRDERRQREQERVRTEERRSIERSIQESIGFLSSRVTESYMEAFRLIQEAELSSQNTSRTEGPRKREDAFRNLRLAFDRMLTDIRSLLDQAYFLRSDMSLKNMPHQSADVNADPANVSARPEEKQ